MEDTQEKCWTTWIKPGVTAWYIWPEGYGGHETGWRVPVEITSEPRRAYSDDRSWVVDVDSLDENFTCEDVALVEFLHPKKWW